MTKKIFTRLLVIAVMALVAVTTSCSNEYKGMQTGEVRLRENDYRNDDNLQSITVTIPAQEEGAQDKVRHVSALEMRTMWHSVIIRAERELEYAEGGKRNTYASPAEVESAFFSKYELATKLLKQQYPDIFDSVVQEFVRADVYVHAHYMWCSQPDDYVKLKFTATPWYPESTPDPETPEIPSTPSEEGTETVENIK